jgi:PleD family two-component response regulator
MNGAARGTLSTIAERLRSAVARVGASHGWPVSASLGGICTRAADRDTPQSLIARADDAMFLAKKGGKNRATIQFDGERHS